MSRQRDTGARRGDARTTPTSIPDMAKALRRARTRQGLRLEDVSARTGLPLEQLQALEIGTVERIPDRVAIVRTLRRYADHLGLPGDRFVLSMVDQWPTTIDRPTSVVAVQPVAGTTAAAPQVSPNVAVPAPVGQLDTGVVPITSPPLAATASVPAGTLVAGSNLGAATTPEGPREASPRSVDPPTVGDHRPMTISPSPDTGIVPVYQPPTSTRTGSRRSRTPLALRIVVGVAAVAVLVGVAGLVADHYEPHWLRDLGITHGPPSSSTQGTAGGHSSSPGSTTQPSFAVASTTADSATLAVGSLSFTVEVTAVNGSTWVQGTAAGNTAPTFAGVLTTGGTHAFSAQRSLVLMVGSIAAHLAISVQGKTVGTYVPSAAPFTVTVQSTP
ncbi:MAG TPA: helix-turn-helix domain-containing protein [Acidimicrobiales bacterium]|nr:helix-turn-helix domain-containing protein [Acidimicrobiales bacterium]